MTNINLLLFNNFETLDLFGPIEVFGRVESFKLNYFSIYGKCVRSSQGAEILTQKIDKADENGILLIPGGQGTRYLVNDEKFIEKLLHLAKQSQYCLSVCTGSALLAKTGILKGRKATSNKKAFDWVKSVDTEVNWLYEPRWVIDGKFYTSGGVSAGIDMTLGFIADFFDEKKALEIAQHIEYTWNPDKNSDLFSNQTKI